MRSSACGLFLMFAVVFFPSRASAEQNPLDSFQSRLMKVAAAFQKRGFDFKLGPTVVERKISDPKTQTLQILDSARLLVESEGRLYVKTLEDLDVPRQSRLSMAAELAEKGVVHQGDYLVKVEWVLDGQKFYNQGTVHPEIQVPPDFEPLSYFTTVLIEVEKAGLEHAALPAADRRHHATPIRFQGISNAVDVEKKPRLLKQAWQVKFHNGYGVCATVQWSVKFMTDGCRILDTGQRAHSEPQDSSGSPLSCLFWEIQSTTKEVADKIPQSECPRLPGSDSREEDCLKSWLVYQKGLNVLGRFFPTAKGESEWEYTCCHSSPAGDHSASSTHSAARGQAWKAGRSLQQSRRGDLHQHSIFGPDRHRGMNFDGMHGHGRQPVALQDRHQTQLQHHHRLPLADAEP